MRFDSKKVSSIINLLITWKKFGYLVSQLSETLVYNLEAITILRPLLIPNGKTNMNLNVFLESKPKFSFLF